MAPRRTQGWIWSPSILIFLALITRAKAYQDFDIADAEVLRSDRFDESFGSEVEDAPAGPQFYDGPYDFQWSRSDNQGNLFQASTRSLVHQRESADLDSSIRHRFHEHQMTRLTSGKYIAITKENAVKCLPVLDDAKNDTGNRLCNAPIFQFCQGNGGFDNRVEFTNEDLLDIKKYIQERNIEYPVALNALLMATPGFDNSLSLRRGSSFFKPVYCASTCKLTDAEIDQNAITWSTGTLVNNGLVEYYNGNLQSSADRDFTAAICAIKSARVYMYPHVNSTEYSLSLQPLDGSDRWNIGVDPSSPNMNLKAGGTKAPLEHFFTPTPDSSVETNWTRVTLRSKALPKLSRSQFLFRHIAQAEPDATPSFELNVRQEDLSRLKEPKVLRSVPIAPLGQWSMDTFHIPPLVKKRERIFLDASFPTRSAMVGFKDVHFYTRERCSPRWHEYKGHHLNLVGVQNLAPALNEYESSKVTKEMLAQRFGLFNFTGISLELCARYCFLGSGCDVFQFTPSSATTGSECLLTPHLGLKFHYWFQYAEKVVDPSLGTSLFVLECSTAMENLLQPNVPWLGAWNIESTCSLTGNYLHTQNHLNPIYVHGSNVVDPWFSLCSTDTHYARIFQLSEGSLPLGMTTEYLNVFKPSGILRLWFRGTQFDQSTMEEVAPRSGISHTIDIDFAPQGPETDTFSDSSELAQTDKIIGNVVELLDTPIQYKLTAGADQTGFFSFMDLLIDMPVRIGCFQEDPAGVPKGAGFIPTSCLVECFQSGSKRFAGLFKGSECVCFDEYPRTSQVPLEKCEQPCNNDPNQFCGSSNELLLFIAQCPIGQKRIGNTCLKLLDFEQTIVTNSLDCATQDMTLWYPTSYEEFQLVALTFGPDAPKVHVGYRALDKSFGTLNSDYSTSTGIAFVTNGPDGEILLDRVNSSQSLLTQETCVVMNLETQKLELAAPCSLARGICSQRLGGRSPGLVSLEVDHHDSFSPMTQIPALNLLPSAKAIQFAVEKLPFMKDPFFEIALPRKASVCGFQIQSHKEHFLEQFRVKYQPVSYVTADAWKTIEWAQQPLIFGLLDFERSSSLFNLIPSDVIASTLFLPRPIFTQRIRLFHLKLAAKTVQIKINVLGAEGKSLQMAHPTLQPLRIDRVFWDLDFPNYRYVSHGKTDSYDGKTADFCPGGMMHVKVSVKTFSESGVYILIREFDQSPYVMWRVQKGSDGQFTIRSQSIEFGSNGNDRKMSYGPWKEESIENVVQDLVLMCTNDSIRMVLNGQAMPDLYSAYSENIRPTLSTFYLFVVMGQAYQAILDFDRPKGLMDEMRLSAKHTFPNSLRLPVGLVNDANLMMYEDQEGLIYNLYQKSNRAESTGIAMFELEFDCQNSVKGLHQCLPTSGRSASQGTRLLDGDSTGFGSGQCPTGFDTMGSVCIGMTVQLPSNSLYSSPSALCPVGQELFRPFKRVDNLAFQSYMTHKFGTVNRTHIWIGIKKNQGQWMDLFQEPVSESAFFWARGQPVDGTSKDCIVADMSLGFKWRPAGCNEARVLCMLKQNRCPSGYTWLPEFEDSCFKVTEPHDYLLDSNASTRYSSYFNHEESCQKDGTRLAQPLKKSVLEGVGQWAQTQHSPDWKFVLGFRYQKAKNLHIGALQSEAEEPYSGNYEISAFTQGCVAISDKSTTSLLQDVPCETNEPQTDPLNTRALCQMSSCLTESDKFCRFPFRFRGKLYDSCTTIGGDGSPWCAIETDESHNYIYGKWLACPASCPVNNCPVGYYRLYPDITCYKISSTLSHTLMGSFDAAEDACAREGARLFEPKNLDGMETLLALESRLGATKYPGTDAPFYFATGLRFAQVDGISTPSYRDGTLVPENIRDLIITWATNHPPIDSTGLCMAIFQSKVVAIPCDGYYEEEPVVTDFDQPRLGFICEARPTETIRQDPPQVCHFPFLHDGHTYHSCAQPILGIESEGFPWCATKVDEKQEMLEFGPCQDERAIIYQGAPGITGHMCSLPFLMDDVLYDTCTRNTPTKRNDKYWCPTRSQANQEKPFTDTELGLCQDFVIPEPNGCDDHFDLVNGTCLRYFGYPLNVVEAQAKCEEEGGWLMSIIDEESETLMVDFIESKVEQYAHYSLSDAYWLGASHDNTSWSWQSHKQEFGQFTRWKSGIKDIGCAESPCSNLNGLVALSSDEFAWRGADFGEQFPFVCQSRCRVGFRFFKSVQKCLKIVPDPRNTSHIKRTLGGASRDCGQNNGRLATFRSCSNLTLMATEMAMDPYENIPYTLGIFHSLDDPRRARLSNPNGFVDTRGYAFRDNGPMTWNLAGGMCQKSLASLPPVNSNVPHAFAMFHTPKDQTYHMEINANMENMEARGYICEQEEIWGCPKGYVMMLEDCYLPVTSQAVPWMDAEMKCRADGGTLMRPRNNLQLHLMNDFVQSHPSGSFWIGYNEERDKNDNPWNLFDAPSTGFRECIAVSPDGSSWGAEHRKCTEVLGFICQKEQDLREDLVALLPKPEVLMPLSQAMGSKEISGRNVETNDFKIGFSTEWIRNNMVGSALLSNTDPDRPASYIEMNLGEPKIYRDFTIMLWVNFKSIAQEEDIMTFESGLRLYRKEDRIGFTLPLTNPADSVEAFGPKFATLIPDEWQFIALSFRGSAGEFALFLEDQFGDGTDDGENTFVTGLWGSSVPDSLLSGMALVGANHENERSRYMNGKITCLQIYNEALDPAQIYHLRQCQPVEQEAHGPCFSDYEYYDGMCYRISLDELSFTSAEIACSPVSGPKGMYKSTLMWTEEKHRFEFVGRLLDQKLGLLSFWVGLDKQWGGNAWETSDGVRNISEAHPIWQPSSTFTTQRLCAKMPGPNGGFIEPEDCNAVLPYVCQMSPLNIEPDNPCPLDYIYWKGSCLKPVEEEESFTAAKDNCAQAGSTLYAPKTQSGYHFMAAYAQANMPRDIWIGVQGNANFTRFDDDPNFLHPLRMEYTKDKSYADGTLYVDEDNFDFNYNGRSFWKGPCLFLKASVGYSARDTKCHTEAAYFCEWQGLTCPPGYSQYGQLSSGRNCFAILDSPSPLSEDICHSSQDKQRHLSLPSKGLITRFLPKLTDHDIWINMTYRNGSKGWMDGLNNTLSSDRYPNLEFDLVNLIPPEDVASGCMQMSENGVLIPRYGAKCSSELAHGLCEYTGCFTKKGQQCQFPFKYRNISDDGITEVEMEFHQCATIDLHRPWCATELNPDKTIKNWDYCLADCPHDDVIVACLEEPKFPKFAPEGDLYKNYTANYEPGSQRVLLELDFVTFDCPGDYAFEDSQNITHYAICYNWEYFYNFDPEAVCVPSFCHCPPFFANGSKAGWTSLDDAQWTQCNTEEGDIFALGSEVTYNCPEGYVFETPELEFWGLETQELTLTCAQFNAWKPGVTPKCIPLNCTEDPLWVASTDQGAYDWDEVVRNRSFTMEVTYSCPGKGWGFPSTGENSLVSVCQASKTWSVTKVEDCKKLPCPKAPLAAPIGGWKWFEFDRTRYRCPNGFEFKMAGFPFFFTECTAAKFWNPTQIEECVPRKCKDPPPSHHWSVGREWRHEDTRLGAQIYFQCPHKRSTWNPPLKEQVTTCIWDKESDQLLWFPDQVLECNREYW